jgi:K+-sensing histidine kinase KdpD
MPHLFNQRDIDNIKADLKIFLTVVKGPIDKLDYFTTILPELKRSGKIELEYRLAQIDMVTEVENAVIRQLEEAEQKEISIQLYLSPASFIIQTDKLFFQQVFFRLFSTMLEMMERKSGISVYVTDSDGKCLIEVIGQHKTSKPSSANADDYFKKHRITNALTQNIQQDVVLPVYKNLFEDLNGKLQYSFTKDGANYFRMKFAIV